MENNIISNRLKEALKIKGIKQAELVSKTGIPKSSISSYLSGKYIPKQVNIYKIAEALNITPTWLLGYDVPMEFDKNGKLHKKYSIDDLKQKLINHLYESEELNYCTEEIELLKIILENEKN